MQIIDVLRDHARRLAAAMELCEREMSARRPRLAEKYPSIAKRRRQASSRISRLAMN